ncbi:TlpA family protein disulfide reductase [Patescibacteria group bacterium]|nr:TlpA family protein disulfide reductase [Patescibacteria group bacterium]
MNAKIIISIAIVAVVLGVIVIVLQRGSSSQPADVSIVSLDSSIKNLALKDYNGKTVTLADFSGKPLVINAWAAWCPFCRKELPDFVTAQKEFGDKVVIIAINRQESLAVAKGYTDMQGTSNDLIFLLDQGDSFYQAISGFSMPETIFVDRNGAIAEHKRGPMDINEIRQKIQKLISS